MMVVVMMAVPSRRNEKKKITKQTKIPQTFSTLEVDKDIYEEILPRDMV